VVVTVVVEPVPVVVVTTRQGDAHVVK